MPSLRKRISLLLAVVILSSAGQLFSQTPHLVGWHSKQPFTESFASCFQKAYEAMELSTLENVQVHDGWVISGNTRFLRVAISCIQVQEGVMINIQVAATAAHEKTAERMRDQLKSHIQTREFPDGARFENYLSNKTTISPQLSTSKNSYRPLEKIVIRFSNLPTDHPQAWITIVPYDARPGSFRQWHYTKDQRNGSMEFMGLTRGRYEARFHHSNNDKEIRARCVVEVD